MQVTALGCTLWCFQWLKHCKYISYNVAIVRCIWNILSTSFKNHISEGFLSVRYLYIPRSKISMPRFFCLLFTAILPKAWQFLQSYMYAFLLTYILMPTSCDFCTFLVFYIVLFVLCNKVVDKQFVRDLSNPKFYLVHGFTPACWLCEKGTEDVS